jgi:hypothetical protein
VALFVLGGRSNANLYIHAAAAYSNAWAATVFPAPQAGVVINSASTKNVTIALPFVGRYLAASWYIDGAAFGKVYEVEVYAKAV